MLQDHHLIVKMLNLIVIFFIQQLLNLHSFILKVMQILILFLILLYPKIQSHHLILQHLITILVELPTNFKIIVNLMLEFLEQARQKQKCQQHYLKLMQFKIQVQMFQQLKFDHH